MDRLPSAEEWAGALGLKKRGRMAWAGPCPDCGGKDRFHVEDKHGRAVVGCRGCLDSLPKPARAKRFGELLHRVFPTGQTAHTPPPSVQRPSANSPTGQFAKQLWDRAGEIPRDETHPARCWMRHRHLWRPGLDLPPAIRWLPAALYHRPGVTMAGSIVAAFKVLGPAPLSSVELVHVDGDGAKTLDAERQESEPQSKRSFGPRVIEEQRAFCVFGLLDGATAVHVVEGLADGLAVAARIPEPVIVVGGTSGYGRLVPDLARFQQVTVWPDPDEAGGRAARVLAGKLAGRGVQVELRHASGEDPGASGVPFEDLDHEDLYDYIADLKRDGLPRWEAGRLASQIVGPPRVKEQQTALVNMPERSLH